MVKDLFQLANPFNRPRFCPQLPGKKVKKEFLDHDRKPFLWHPANEASRTVLPAWLHQELCEKEKEHLAEELKREATNGNPMV